MTSIYLCSEPLVNHREIQQGLKAVINEVTAEDEGEEEEQEEEEGEEVI